jgi:hypothetical protein
VDKQTDASGPISLNVNLSEDEEFTRQGSLQVRFDPDKYTCELRLRMASYEELNAWLLDRCVAYAKAHRHPELADRTIWQTFEAERPQLVPIGGPFDGFHATQASVSKTCLVRFDNNKYSVASRAVGRPVEIQAHADRIVIRQDGAVVGEHSRCFGRGETI